MFENIIKFFKNIGKKEEKNETENSKDAAKERLHLVLMQDRANVSADFLELMKQEIIEVIKKYIDVDESAIDVRLTNKENEDGTNGAPALYANIPIKNIKNEARKVDAKDLQKKKEEQEKVQEDIKQENDKQEEKSNLENENDGSKNKESKKEEQNTEEENDKKLEKNQIEGINEAKEIIKESENSKKNEKSKKNFQKN